VLEFVSISCPSRTTWSQATSKLEYAERNDYEGHHAISNSLPSDRSSSWRITISSGGGGCMGVIGTCDGIPADSLFHPLSVMWESSGGYTCIKGAGVRSKDGWKGCDRGDVLTFTNNPSNSTITVHNSRTRRTHTLSTRGLPAVHVHICLWSSISLNISMV
jgi:hypothetical protein